MDLPPQPPPATGTVRADDSEIEKRTRLHPNRMGKQPAPNLTNGALKRHKLPPPVKMIYGKCLKNYAAETGGHILDGCGEFMLSPTTTSLECDACGCHRNYHRLEVDQLHQPISQIIGCQCHHQHRHHLPASPTSHPVGMTKSNTTPDSQSPPPISSSYYPVAPNMFLALNPGFTPPELANSNHPSILTPAIATGSNPKGKKRFRSKFTENQKSKMQEFAERIGWKMLKTEEEMIVEFCKHIGVTKGVFKVWMHNHKATSNQGNKTNAHQNDQNHNGNEINANDSSKSS